MQSWHPLSAKRLRLFRRSMRPAQVYCKNHASCTTNDNMRACVRGGHMKDSIIGICHTIITTNGFGAVINTNQCSAISHAIKRHERHAMQSTASWDQWGVLGVGSRVSMRWRGFRSPLWLGLGLPRRCVALGQLEHACIISRVVGHFWEPLGPADICPSNRPCRQTSSVSVSLVVPG